MKKLLEKTVNNNKATKSEILELYNGPSKMLFEFANDVRKKYVKDEIHLRSLIEFSNYCNKSCLYCGIRFENSKIKRYRMEIDEIKKLIEITKKLNLKTIVLQSGEDSFYCVDKICQIIRLIKQENIVVTLSIGEKTYEEYLEYKKAGASRYLLRIETTDKKLYKKMHPKASYENRIKCLENIKNLGYELGTGILVGLPNQTLESIVEDIFFFKNIKADMIGLGPFIPANNTPLFNQKSPDIEYVLKTIAIIRILMPKINIPATTAIETLNRGYGRLKALNCGCNVVMLNINFEKYKNNYQIYQNKNTNGSDVFLAKEQLINEFKNINRYISEGFGNALK